LIRLYGTVKFLNAGFDLAKTKSGFELKIQAPPDSVWRSFVIIRQKSTFVPVFAWPEGCFLA